MDNQQIKDGLGNLFTIRMRDYSTSVDGTLQRSMVLASFLPIEYGIGGMYGHAAKSGILPNAPAMTSTPIYSFYWPGAPPATLKALVRRVRLSIWTLGMFTAGAATFDIYAARAFSTPDSGGTTANLAAYNNQLATSMAPSRAHIVCANVGPLTPGVRTLDLAPLNSQSFMTPATFPQMVTSAPTTLFERLQGEHPLLLAQNEGFVIAATLPGGGPWQFTITTEWDEVEVF